MDIGEKLKKELSERIKGSLPTCGVAIRVNNPSNEGLGEHLIMGIPYRLGENEVSVSLFGRQIFSSKHSDFIKKSESVSYERVIDYQIFDLRSGLVVK